MEFYESTVTRESFIYEWDSEYHLDKSSSSTQICHNLRCCSAQQGLEINEWTVHINIGCSSSMTDRICEVDSC